MLRGMLQRVLGWITRLFTGHPRGAYRTVFMEELPDRLEEHVIYILGEGEYTWSAAIICPCGCREILHMSLHKEGRPRWELTRHSDGTVSLTPSVWRKIGCQSHFFFERGRIRWCK
ncbi:hypothetical protein PB1_07147 [Bacillus methanolicus PB1]|uniref:Uncharacterized protein n=1 Tax=Bacillus methanolicus PB1 TaxID=997296 RepID=I3E0U6_BACMT|nr:DUF6527 family protein [Bacillus methanolicus]EIJ80117.1 hypothetical protein PB1_07147 [Bacillus methanolicus PB1]